MRILVFLTILLAPAVAYGESGASPEDQARWQRCAGFAQTIMDRTGAVFERTSDFDHNVFMRHPSAKELNVMCMPFQKIGIVSSWSPGGYPSDRFYTVSSIAASIVSNEKPEFLVRAFRKCHDIALDKKADETAEIDTPKNHIECTAFTRDGGSVLISTFPK